jgi:hypothetical protein
VWVAMGGPGHRNRGSRDHRRLEAPSTVTGSARRSLPAFRSSKPPNRGNTGNIPTRRVSNVSPVSQNVESATVDAVDAWLSREFAALNPDADDHGLRVARLRAEAVRRRRGASAVEPLCPYPPSAQLDFGEK